MKILDKETVTIRFLLKVIANAIYEKILLFSRN